MQNLHRSALLPYTVEFVYALVNDIIHYPSFIPWCEHASILSQTDEEIVACLDIRTKGLHESLTTRNRLNPPCEIQLELINGPFQQLTGEWSFQPIGEPGGDLVGCRVSLDLHFSLKQGVAFLEKSLLLSLGRAADSVLNAFADRAKQLAAEPR